MLPAETVGRFEAKALVLGRISFTSAGLVSGVETLQKKAAEVGPLGANHQIRSIAVKKLVAVRHVPQDCMYTTRGCEKPRVQGHAQVQVA